MEGDQAVVGLVSAPALGRRWWAALGHGAYAGRHTAGGHPDPGLRRTPAGRRVVLLLLAARRGRRPAGCRRCWTSCAGPGGAGRIGDFYGYMLVAEGAVDIMVEPELSLWDLAALVPIVTEAGGTFTDLAGRPGPERRQRDRDKRRAQTSARHVLEDRLALIYPRGCTHGRVIWRVLRPSILGEWCLPVGCVSRRWSSRTAAPTCCNPSAAVAYDPHHSMHPSLLLRLAGQRTYLFGVGCQIIGFSLAFLARRELPLFLVQASVAAGLGVMAILGVVVLKWRLPRAEVALLGAARRRRRRPGHLGQARRRAAPIDIARRASILTGVLGVIAIAGVFAARLQGARRLGRARLARRPRLRRRRDRLARLAGAHSWHGISLHPLLYLLFAHALVGQLLLGMAMQRGSTTAAVAAMDAAATAPAAIIGLAMLGDQIWPGRQWLAAAGFVCTLVAVIGLTRYAQPQSHTAAPAVMVRAVRAARCGGERSTAQRPDSGWPGDASGVQQTAVVRGAVGRQASSSPLARAAPQRDAGESGVIMGAPRFSRRCAVRPRSPVRPATDLTRRPGNRRGPLRRAAPSSAASYRGAATSRCARGTDGK